MQHVYSVFCEAVQGLSLNVRSRVVVAVSGGLDSMLLCTMAQRFFSRVHAVTIDHGLRPESGIEADLVCARQI